MFLLFFESIESALVVVVVVVAMVVFVRV